MKKSVRVLFSSAVLVCFSCNTAEKTESESNTVVETPEVVAEKPPLSEAELIINEAIEAQGGMRYDDAHYKFIFRKNTYTFKNNGREYVYTVEKEKDGKKILDVLDNGTLTRTINEEPVTLSEKEVTGYTGALNSVIYFATLPHKLKDKSVRKKMMEPTTIKGMKYDVVEVTFAEEGGGEDFDDEYYYWVNRETKRVDYFAYNYQVNNGGVRFRSAYNPRTVDGIVFQDYINYEAAIGTPLKDLPSLYEKEELKELSRIDTEEVINLK